MLWNQHQEKCFKGLRPCLNVSQSTTASKGSRKFWNFVDIVNLKMADKKVEKICGCMLSLSRFVSLRFGLELSGTSNSIWIKAILISQLLTVALVICKDCSICCSWTIKWQGEEYVRAFSSPQFIKASWRLSGYQQHTEGLIRNNSCTRLITMRGPTMFD